MTEKNEKSINFHEFLTLRRDRECQTIRINQFNFKRNHFDFNRFNHFRKTSQD